MTSSRKPLRFINREITWLYFNSRVLQESFNPDVPLLERLRFLGIYSNNMDEFYRVRVALLRRMDELKLRLQATKDKPDVILKRIAKMTAAMQPSFEEAFETIVQELKNEKISLLDHTQLNQKQSEFVHNFYDSQLLDAITPIILYRSTPFPELADDRIYLAVKLQCNDRPKDKLYALIEVPSGEFSRFLVLPTDCEGESCSSIILLDDVIRLCLPDIFKSLSFDIHHAYTVKITRDAEMDIESEFGESLVDKVSKGIKSRRFGDPLRFVYDEEMPSDLRNYILKQMEFKKTDAIIAGGRYHNFKDFIGFPSLGRQDLVYKPNIALSNLSIKQSKSVLQAVKQSDLFLHYPYFGFSQFVQLLRESAIDSEVLGIHITLYRMAKNSKVARALIYAAKNGKQVTAVVELRARFDEEHNIYWATKMQEAGVNVIFGVEGLKIHSKMTLIRMKKNKGIAAISTGNFHEGNASVYTDFTLFTADNNIVSEVARVFDFIDHPFQNLRFSHLLVSPQEMRKKIYGLITTEINNAKKKLPAFIKCKINHITDQYVIMKLYEAAKAGVKVQLIIRGMTSIIPNQKELKGNLEIVSVVDRYLEHSRIFVFCNNNNPKYYISSADWMRRNLDGRIEVAVPIYDKRIQNELDIILDYGLRDNVKARIVDEHGDNEFKTNDLPSFRSQSELYDYYVRQQEQG